MKELKEIQFNTDNVVLDTNRVLDSILPKNVNELTRDITIRKDTVADGAVYGHKISIDSGDVTIRGALFAHLELHIGSGAKGVIKFEKAVGAIGSVVSHARDCKVMMLSDVNAKEVRLTNAFVGGSIFADEISLVNCVVIGGVFATKELSVESSVMGTFNAPRVSMEGACALLLPSAFSLEPIIYNPETTTLANLALADLGALYRGLPPTAHTGRIMMNLRSDETKSTLTSEESQLTVRSYTVIGRVLAADLIDWEKMQNHFLLTAASLNTKLLDVYDLGLDASGKKAELTPERIYDFFMDLMRGKITVEEIDGTFSISSISERMQH